MGNTENSAEQQLPLRPSFTSGNRIPSRTHLSKGSPHRLRHAAAFNSYLASRFAQGENLVPAAAAESHRGGVSAAFSVLGQATSTSTDNATVTSRLFAWTRRWRRDAAQDDLEAQQQQSPGAGGSRRSSSSPSKQPRPRTPVRAPSRRAGLAAALPGSPQRVTTLPAGGEGKGGGAIATAAAIAKAWPPLRQSGSQGLKTPDAASAWLLPARQSPFEAQPEECRQRGCGGRAHRRRECKWAAIALVLYLLGLASGYLIFYGAGSGTAPRGLELSVTPVDISPSSERQNAEWGDQGVVLGDGSPYQVVDDTGTVLLTVACKGPTGEPSQQQQQQQRGVEGSGGSLGSSG